MCEECNGTGFIRACSIVFSRPEFDKELKEVVYTHQNLGEIIEIPCYCSGKWEGPIN